MKKIIVFFCVLAISHIAVAQNIVPNANFAVDSACPWSGSLMNYCKMWRSATMATPDYFNVCDTAYARMSVPRNFFGYQSSNSHAYAGVYTYSAQSLAVTDYKEYITTTIPPLEPGATYRVTITTSLADSSFYASDGLGVCFSVAPLNRLTLTTIHRAPQINYTSYGVINDKINWVTLTKTFVADSTYANITVGSFTADSDLNLATCSYHSFALPFFDSSAYYYIDSVAVEKIASPSFVQNASNSNIVAIYPNPFTGHATLTFDNIPGELYRLDIYNFQGIAVAEIKDINTGEVRIDRADLPNGLYYYRLRGQSGSLANGKLMME